MILQQIKHSVTIVLTIMSFPHRMFSQRQTGLLGRPSVDPLDMVSTEQEEQ